MQRYLLLERNPIPRPKILVVDDQASIADVLALILNRNGYYARAVYDGEAAIHEFLNESWDAVVTDIEMPGIDGVDAAIEIRKFRPQCPVILVSGMDRIQIDRSLLRAKLQGYSFDLLEKPVFPTELIAKIQELTGPGELARRAAV